MHPSQRDTLEDGTKLFDGPLKETLSLLQLMPNNARTLRLGTSIELVTAPTSRQPSRMRPYWQAPLSKLPREREWLFPEVGVRSAGSSHHGLMR